MKSDLYGYVTTHADIIAAGLESSIYHNYAPQSASLPWIVISISSQSRDLPVAGVELVESHWNFDIWASTPIGAFDAANTLRETLQGFTGTMGTTVIRGIFLEDYLDQTDENIGTDEPVFGVTMDFLIWYED